MFKLTAARTSIRVMLLMAFSVILGLGGTTTATANSGQVLPPGAHPHGYSLDRMTKELALFSTSGNQPQYYPDTPFQILYGAPEKFEQVPDGTGRLTTGSNSFTVKTGTMFFIPLWNADDSPPVVGTFPTSSARVGQYFFGGSQVGGRDFEIIVDGGSKPIGRHYLGGPVKTPPLLDGDGTHMITLGAFLAPLTPGMHTVTIRGGVFGDGIVEAYKPVTFFREDITYTIEVVKKRR